MNNHDVDVAVLGAGFGGCLTALILKQIGLQIVVIDRGSHPRFAIGESSTPIADFVLRDLSRKYDLPQLKPLTTYGTWQQSYPEITCGIKRGFSYFRHEEGRPFEPQQDHSNELLVTASSDDEQSDTHWLRSDVDAFFAREVKRAGISLLENTEITELEFVEKNIWHLTGRQRGETISIRCRFLIDATGVGGVMSRGLEIPIQTEGFHTHSRSIFGHFSGVTPWHDTLKSHGGNLADHPFDCDHAAVHHLFDDGWMWQLRFNNGITSAGFVLDTRNRPLDTAVSPEEEWQELIATLPALAEQFCDAELVQPKAGLQRTGRLQRRVTQVTGPDWAMLPHTAGFIDPLHSTGIAHTLCGIERLVDILEKHWNQDDLPLQLQRYEEILFSELDLIDQLVGGCYAAFADFRLFTAISMLYFAAATTYEHRRADGGPNFQAAFLCADDSQFRS
ncbi:MAG: FAD-dependent oxidoreductase, partial [Planctomycetes bacterium]|nr:FAD-dependent oxidoreductase [Planctomycetota bacterium]